MQDALDLNEPSICVRKGTKSGNGSRIQLDYMPTGAGRMFMMPWPAREDGREEEVTYEPDDSTF